MKIEKVIDNNLCISCGLCSYANNTKMEMKKGIYIPNFTNKIDNVTDKFLYNICPGKGYDIINLSKTLYQEGNTYDYKIGYYSSIGAVRTLDEDFLKNSSSGGMMSYLAFHLLDEKIVDGILTVKFDYTVKGPIPKPFIARTKEDLISAQGSKYMPIPLLQNIDEILNFPGKLAVIGTPCQIAGVRLFQNVNKELQEKINITIANFCGGYRDYRETERIFKVFNVDKNRINFFSYRGNGQPGTMTIKQDNGKIVRVSYPEYARLTGFTKYYRCRLCVDATGELADISFGDAWHNNFLKTGKKWSFYICRSKKLEAIIENLKNKINFQDISYDDLISSQKGNLITKKERQHSRIKLYKLMKMQTPIFDGGYNNSNLNLKLELKVLFSQKMMYFLERTGLYLTVAKIIKRVNRNNYEI